MRRAACGIRHSGPARRPDSGRAAIAASCPANWPAADPAAEQQVPADQRHALVERERHLVGRNGDIHRRARHQVNVDVVGILTRHALVRGVRHRRVQVSPARCHALRQRREEVVLGPAPNAVVGRRRQITAVNRAEWRFQRIAAGQRRPAAGGMAGGAVGGLRQIAAAGDLFGAGGHLLHRTVVTAVFPPPQQRNHHDRHQQNQYCETFFIAPSPSAGPAFSAPRRAPLRSNAHSRCNGRCGCPAPAQWRFPTARER